MMFPRPPYGGSLTTEGTIICLTLGPFTLERMETGGWKLDAPESFGPGALAQLSAIINWAQLATMKTPTFDEPFSGVLP